MQTLRVDLQMAITFLKPVAISYKKYILWHIPLCVASKRDVII